MTFSIRSDVSTKTGKQSSVPLMKNLNNDLRNAVDSTGIRGLDFHYTPVHTSGLDLRNGSMNNDAKVLYVNLDDVTDLS